MPAGRVLHPAVPEPQGPSAGFRARLRLRGKRRVFDFPGQCLRDSRVRRAIQERRAGPRRRVHRAGRVRRGTGALRELHGLGSRGERRLGDSRAPLPLSVRRQRKEDVRRHGGRGAGDARAGGDRGRGHGRQDAHGRLVDPRAGYGAHGERSQDVGAESVPAVPRREESVCGRRLQSRERVVPESHLDHHGAGVALLRVSGGRIQEREPMTVTRREMLEVTAAALAAPLLTPAPVTAATPPAPVLPGAPKFFTAPEFALLDELSDLIIPTDAHSPGARIAGVATYIDFRLSESLDTDQQAKWHSGLAAVDAVSQESNGKAFMQSSPAQRVALLTKIAAAEHDPKTPAEHFFQQLKGWTVRAYYSSKVGIHADQEYKGNVYQRGEYAGYDAK